MDSALSCCAGGPGSIPASAKSGFNIQMIFLPLRSKAVGKKWNHTRYLVI